MTFRLRRRSWLLGIAREVSLRLASAGGARQTTDSGSSFLPVGPIWISVFISGQTPQS